MFVTQAGAVILVGASMAVESGSVTPSSLASRLNEHASVQAHPEETAWQVLEGPLQAIPAPPDAIGVDAAVGIWPGMSDWDAWSAWAGDQDTLGAAIKEAAQRPVFGLKYGREAAGEANVEKGLFIDLGAEGERLVLPEFGYLRSINRLLKWSATEAYRLSEAGKGGDALALMLDTIMVLRRVADREFVAEKEAAIRMMSSGLEVMRDLMYRYLDDIPGDALKQLALHEIPSLRPGRDSLFMPEHDRRLAEAFLENAFDEKIGTADPEEFQAVFTEVQASSKPLQRFGARRRWADLQDMHDSLEYSQERLALIFDDWWRRWRSNDLDQLGRLILNQQSQFELLNVARFAALDAVVHDMSGLFEARDRLLMEVNASSVAAGLAAYKSLRGVYPKELRMTFGITMDKQWAVDTHAQISEGYRPWFVYRYMETPRQLDIGTQRVMVPAETGLLYSRGLDGLDNLAVLHADERGSGDLIIWPPPRDLIRAKQRDASE
ncbi:MAG: hypothetical protein QF561_06415 [Phycisphaerales bacterium]|jgi:hypothetical protein|nr:hypothetical protein [Phycisphaerales bacterium]